MPNISPRCAQRWIVRLALGFVAGSMAACGSAGDSQNTGGAGGSAGAGATTTTASTTGEGGAAGGAPARERLFVGTGEYSAAPDWHAILRFDDAEKAAANGAGMPDATMPVKQLTSEDGIPLLFAHGMYLHEGRDELWLATLFTNGDGAVCMMCSPQDPAEPGSIGVVANASSADGPQKLARHIFGGKPEQDLTQLVQPHGLWIDEGRDILYVASTFGGQVLAFHDTAMLDGNVAPDRVIDPPDLGTPVFVFIDSAADRLFVASMPSGPQAPMPAIVVFNGASTREGNAPPDMLLRGPQSRLAAGNNQTTHNVWYDAPSKQLFVAHHTNEVLIYDFSSVDLDSPPPELDLAPRVIDASASDADIPSTSVYGLFYVPEADRLYVSVGYANMGPKPGTPPNGVAVYDGVTSKDVSGRVKPSRVIGWASGNQYFPPQPLWVTRQPE